MKELKFEIRLTAFLTGLAVALWLGWAYLLVSEFRAELVRDGLKAMETFVFLLIGLVLFYGNIVYLMTRYGRLRREQVIKHPDSSVLDAFFYKNDNAGKNLTILVPSYKEELRVVEMTLLSAALQEFESKNVVLLVDDPVKYSDTDSQKLLEETLSLPEKIEKELGEVQKKIVSAFDSYQIRQKQGDLKVEKEITELVAVFNYQKEWFEERLRIFAPKDHAEEFFAKFKFEGGIERINLIQSEIKNLIEKQNIDWHDISSYYRKAMATFSVSISYFQRKRYENISHEPNKAMNLNSYIALIGKEWGEVRRGDELFLEEAVSGDGFKILKCDYLITLDADSVLSVSYARRLVYFLEQEENAQVAVAQTPYNTFRSPSVNIEKIAGATTDIQHHVHQGFEYFNASFWVGANALLRYEALADILELDSERGYTIKRYIQDRTVIEDTESSIDLVFKGWKVFNYHEQLAYSATPPDFGTLIIQRRRWANGGVIIFPKLFRYLLSGKTPFLSRLMEFFVRTHYLLSTAFVSVAVFLMMIYPFDGNLHIGPLVLASLVYFYLYGRDLLQMGYARIDLFRVYALNLLLLPINLAGTIKSIEQLITKQKIPFVRTPKVGGRTAASLGFIMAEIGLTIYITLALVFDVVNGYYEHAIFSGINAVFLLYACTRLIGWKDMYEDIWASLSVKK